MNKQTKETAWSQLALFLTAQKEEKLQETNNTQDSELVGHRGFDAAFLLSPKSQSSMSVYSHSKFKLVCSIMQV